MVRPICKKIYLREVYKVLWGKITDHIANCPDSLKSNSVIHVSGTAGIGKTRFLYYLLCKLRDSGKKVMLTLKDEHIFLDGQPGLLSFDSPRAQELSPDIYIYDPVYDAGTPLTYFNCMHIIISSPDTIHIKHVKQTGFNRQRFYMPLWSLDEILKCRSLVYPNIEETQVKQCFSLWGGIPSICFQEQSHDQHLSSLRVLLKQPNRIERLVQRMLCTEDLMDDNFLKEMQWLTYIKPTADFRAFCYVWPSPVIKMKVLISLSTLYSSFTYRNTLLKTCNNTAIGNVYEGYVKSLFLHQIFTATIPDIYREAGKITCTFKQSKETIDIPFPTTVEFLCGNSTVLEIDSHKVYIPLESNFPTVDLVYPPHLIQITTAKEHTVNQQGLKLVSSIFPNQKEWNLIFVIPEARVANFKAKSGKKHCLENNISFYYIAEIDFPDKLQLTELQNNQMQSDVSDESD